MKKTIEILIQQANTAFQAGNKTNALLSYYNALRSQTMTVFRIGSIETSVYVELNRVKCFLIRLNVSR